MLKSISDNGKNVFWGVIVGIGVLLVSFFPEHHRPAIKKATEENAWWGFAFLNGKKSYRENQCSTETQERTS